jgi:hypothetical protein
VGEKAESGGLENVPVLTQIGGGPTTDGKGIVIVWTLEDGQTAKFAIPVVEIPTVIGYMMNEAKRAADLCSEQDLQALAKPHQSLAGKITSIALGPGSDAKHEVLYIRIGHLRLSFEIPASVLLAVATKIVRLSEPE